MTRPTSFARPRLGLAALLVVAAGVAAACGAQATPSGAPSGSPAVTPTPAPSAPATPAPTPDPTATPAPSIPGQTVVDLDVALDHEVSVVVDDLTGKLAKASTGRAGDGMSVRWFDSEVVNVDDDSLRVTWVGLPRAEQIKLSITEKNGSFVLTFEQAAPPANSDATGYDRVLILDFETLVRSEEIEVVFVEAAA